MDEFDSLETEEEKVEYLKKLLEPVAEKSGGKIRYVQRDEEVQCTGKYEGRALRIIMDSSTGGLKVELKLRNTVGTMRINYDPDAVMPEEEPDPEWESGEEQRWFIAQYYYLENYPERLAAEKKAFESLERAELEKVMLLMKRLGIGWIDIDSTLLMCGLFESLYDAGEIYGIVQAMHSFALQFEKEGEQVEPQPSVVLGGVEVKPELVAWVMLCPYCNTNVSVGKDRKCPNCGAGL